MSDVPAGYQRVAALSDVPAGGCLAVDLAGERVVLLRVGESVFALQDQCPHAGAPLSKGFLEGDLLTCSWHGWTFNVRNGISSDDPELSVPVFAVLILDGEVLVRRGDSTTDSETSPGTTP